MYALIAVAAFLGVQMNLTLSFFMLDLESLWLRANKSAQST